MIKLIQTGGPYGDCTSDFNVKFDRPYTIGEFIKEIYEEATERSWGHVYVTNGRDRWDGKAICFYRYGWEKPCPPVYLDRVIESATCNGGWSLLNFYVTLKEEVPENARD